MHNFVTRDKKWQSWIPKVWCAVFKWNIDGIFAIIIRGKSNKCSHFSLFGIFALESIKINIEHFCTCSAGWFLLPRKCSERLLECIIRSDWVTPYFCVCVRLSFSSRVGCVHAALLRFACQRLQKYLLAFHFRELVRVSRPCKSGSSPVFDSVFSETVARGPPRLP